MPGFPIEEAALLTPALLTTVRRVPYPGTVFIVPKVITQNPVENQNFLTPYRRILGKTHTRLTFNQRHNLTLIPVQWQYSDAASRAVLPACCVGIDTHRCLIEGMKLLQLYKYGAACFGKRRMA